MDWKGLFFAGVGSVKDIAAATLVQHGVSFSQDSTTEKAAYLAGSATVFILIQAAELAKSHGWSAITDSRRYIGHAVWSLANLIPAGVAGYYAGQDGNTPYSFESAPAWYAAGVAGASRLLEAGVAAYMDPPKKDYARLPTSS